MQSLGVSGAVRTIYGSLGVKRLTNQILFSLGHLRTVPSPLIMKAMRSVGQISKALLYPVTILSMPAMSSSRPGSASIKDSR